MRTGLTLQSGGSDPLASLLRPKAWAVPWMNPAGRFYQPIVIHTFIQKWHAIVTSKLLGCSSCKGESATARSDQSDFPIHLFSYVLE